MTITQQANDDAPEGSPTTAPSEAPEYPSAEDAGTPESEALASKHSAIHSVIDDVVTYRTACEGRDFSPTAAECMALDYHHFLFANAERAAQLQHEASLTRIRMIDQFVTGMKS